MDEKKTVQKIVVSTDNELTDIVREIHKSKAERIILTFTDHSDILISPINLKVIEETAKREDKLLVAQIIQNPTGVRNSKLAKIKVIETPSNPTEEDWEEALELKTPPKSTPEKRVEQERDLTTPTQERKKSSFEDRVNNIISNSKEYRKKEEIKEEVPIINIDSDIEQPEEKVENTPVKEDMTGRDFAPLPDEAPKVQQTAPIKEPKEKKAFVLPFVLPKLNGNIKKYLKHSWKFLVPLLGIVILGFLAYYRFVPIVKLRIFVEAKPVEVEKIFQGDKTIENIDFDNLKIPIKEEALEKGLSENITPTGTAYKGQKASGSITLTYTKQGGCSDADEIITLPAGQVISTQNLSYKLTGSTELTCESITDVTIQAAEIGEEYNIDKNRFFSVPGYASTQLFGMSISAFSGGSKEEYTVLSQQDVDDAVESFSTTAIEEVKSDLRAAGNGWDIIENTIKSEVDKDSIKTDIPVGGEADTVNLQLTIKGTATYYLTKGLTEGLTDLLRTEANEQNLFESNDNLNLVLGDNIEKELSVEESSKDSVKIKLVAKSTVKPEVNKTEIENTIKGMKWDQGLEYLSNLSFAAQPTEIEFTPSNFPQFLRYFPDKQGGVLITVIDLQTN